MRKDRFALVSRSGSQLLAAFGAMLISGGLLISVYQSLEPEDALQRIREKGELHVLLLESLTNARINARKELVGAGPELAAAWAWELGVRPVFHRYKTLPDLLRAMEDGAGDLAIPGIVLDTDLPPDLIPGPPYALVSQQVVCRGGRPPPANFPAMEKRRFLLPDGSRALGRMREFQAIFPGMQLTTDTTAGSDEVLRRVAAGKADCTVMPSDYLTLSHRYHAGLYPGVIVRSPRPLHWILPRAGVDPLRQHLQDWFNRLEEEDRLQAMLDPWYSGKGLHAGDYRLLEEHIRTRLPGFRALFRRYAEKFDLPWTLLAAISYQESNWNPKARSRTGVRGMMMLTRTTAARMGVTNRLDAGKSIYGGARYFASLRRRVPEGVQGGDRDRMALAAYNMGFGHLRDAMGLAGRLGRDPHQWPDLRDTLPLLARRRYYRSLPHGYARGWESVDFVRRVITWHEILLRRLGPAALEAKL